jgi:predicted aspartyl protease
MAWWDVTLPSSLTKFFLIANCALLASVTAEPNVVSLPLHRNQRRSIVKRSHASASLENDYIDGLFWVNATVGTPGQLVQLQIDTGSSDIWVFGARSCTESASGCLGGFCECQMP